MRPQGGAGGDQIGFGGMKLGIPVAESPITCLHPVVCEDRYESVWVRVWHEHALIQRVDIVYSGWETKGGAEIRSSPITLPQAIRSHSFRYGRRTPRLGFAGNEGHSRIVADVANGIVYFANAVSETGLVTEVRYLPTADPLVQRASASLLSGRGAWLIRAALLSPRYKNLLAEPGTSGKKPTDEPQGLTPEKTSTPIGEVALH